MEFVLVRGLPGSGKSTYVKKFFPSFDHFEADDYFRSIGVYTFDMHHIEFAHALCQMNVRKSLYHGRRVVVSNVFHRMIHIIPYISIAEYYGMHLDILKMCGEFESIHGVPQVTYDAMKLTWEDCPTEKIIDNSVNDGVLHEQLNLFS